MNTKTIYKLGSLVAALGITTTGYAISATIDNFNTFVPNPGFDITDTNPLPGAGNNVIDGPDSLPLTDTFFAGISRRVTVDNIGGTGNAKIRNNLGFPIDDEVGFSIDTGVFGVAQLRYDASAITWPTGVDINNVFDRFGFLFTSVDFAGSLTVSIMDISSIISTITEPVPAGIVSPTTIELLYSQAVGFASLDNVRRITFTLTPFSNGGADWRFDAVFFDNPNIPEASTAIPALAFAGVVGYFGWRRSRAKTA